MPLKWGVRFGGKIGDSDVKVEAMEDFVGRGDRRLAEVVRRAWELGAGMDSWWENLDQAYSAWEQAIAESDLTWKYRQVENGEWNLFQNSAEEGAIQELHSQDATDAPLPWDHLNTGIDKQWLKEDLKRALEAATVPDCAFDSCSHCGVCGTDFGHNIVVPPPAIPKFAGHFQPNQQRAQKIRVWFGKQAEMALVSHLDLVRLFDRAIRRAALPISFTGGYHPGPRIAIANALSLGHTSSGEIVDFELSKDMELEEFCSRLVAQLPANIPLYKAEEVDLKSPAATQILTKAEYIITVAATEEDNIGINTWEQWIAAVKNSKEIIWEKTTKSGKKQQVNLSERLFSLTIESTDNLPVNTIKLRFVGSCRNDGTKLSPDNLVYMLEQIIEREFSLSNVHRQQLILDL